MSLLRLCVHLTSPSFPTTLLSHSYLSTPITTSQMAQGAIKSRRKPPTTISSSSSSKTNPKKGHRQIAPKKKKLVEQGKITKVRSSPPLSLLLFIPSSTRPLHFQFQFLLHLHLQSRRGAKQSKFADASRTDRNTQPAWQARRKELWRRKRDIWR